jgi:hypothetical protein
MVLLSKKKRDDLMARNIFQIAALLMVKYTEVMYAKCSG